MQFGNTTAVSRWMVQVLPTEVGFRKVREFPQRQLGDDSDPSYYPWRKRLNLKHPPTTVGGIRLYSENLW